MENGLVVRNRVKAEVRCMIAVAWLALSSLLPAIVPADSCCFVIYKKVVPKMFDDIKQYFPVGQEAKHR